MGTWKPKTTLKNGANPKSHTSRKTLICIHMKRILLLFVGLLMVGTTFSQSGRSVNSLQRPTGESTFDSSGPSLKLSPVMGSAVTMRTQSLPPVFSFQENPVNHNMHITTDGMYYFTINGGNSSSGQVNKFDLNGVLLQSYPIAIDGRGLSYNKMDGHLYVSGYGGDIIRIDDLSAGTFTIVFPTIMQNAQGSFDISTDGSLFYDFYQGNLIIRDFNTGAVMNTINGLSYGPSNYGGEASVAVDSSHIYTWNATTRTVYAYDMSGTFIQSLELDSGDNGHSLSIAQGYLFVSKDGNYSIGTWYGYDIGGAIASVPASENKFNYSVYPNPSTGKLKLEAPGAEAIEVYNAVGVKVYTSLVSQQTYDLDISRYGKGVYFLNIYKEGIPYREKICIQ